MKNIYSILSLCLILVSVSVFGQSKIYAPMLSAPADMEVGQMPDVLLDWDAVTGNAPVIEYEVQLADNIDFANAETFEKTDLTAMAMENLLFGGTYFWRVKAYDGDNESDWSEAWSFTVLWTVDFSTPSDGAEVYADPVVSWDEITGIDGYVFQMDTVYDWSIGESGVSDDILGSEVVAEDDIWVVGAGGMVLHFDGSTWTPVDIGTTEDLTGVDFIDANNGFVVGTGGTVVQYNGTDWTIVDVGTTEDLTGISFADADNGVVVGNSGTIIVYSAGTWSEAVSGDDNDLFAVSMISASSIWAAGDGSVVVSYNGTDWAVEEVGTKDHYGIAMVDANNGWVVSKSGKIHRWNGELWYEETSPTAKDLYAICFSGMTGYAVGKSGTMLKFNGSWIPVTTGLEENLQTVTVMGENGIVAGEEGVMLNKGNGGFNSPYLVTFDVPADSANWYLYNLLFGETFYYRIKAFHDNDTSMWSGVKSMTTYAAPELDSPDDGSENDLLLRFEWSTYEGTTNYIFEIDTDENFGMPRSFAPDDDTLWVNDLVFGEEYFWRVAAQHAEDISDWSEVWSFTTVNEIYLESPDNNAVEVGLCPLFTWIEVAGTSSYEMWVDTDASFPNPNIYNGSDPSYQCQSTLVANTVYYWKVRGKSGALVSDWSETWSFRTEQGIGINEIVDGSVMIYPNPGNGQFVLNVTTNEANSYDLKVIDITGKLVFESGIELNAGNNSIPVTIDNIGSGTYNLIICNEKQNVSKQLIIK